LTIVEALSNTARDLCEQVSRSTSEIADAVIIGNTAMLHLFAKLLVEDYKKSSLCKHYFYNNLGRCPNIAKAILRDIPFEEKISLPLL
jgi:hypothetical protein